MKKRNTAVVPVLVLTLLFLMTGCADMAGEAADNRETKKPEPDDSVFYEDNSVYRWGKPNALEFVIPRVPDPVSSESFYEDYGPVAVCGFSLDCLYRDMEIQDGDFWSNGTNLYYPKDDGNWGKVCTRDDCREDINLPCVHVITGAAIPVRFEDAVYFPASFAGVEGGVQTFAVLEWKIGANDFDKLFETNCMITSLHVVNGVLYIGTVSNLPDAPYLWYAVRMDREICSESSTQDVLLFGEDGIVSIGAVGVTVLDELLNPLRTILDRQLFGALAGGYYWYIENGDLWRIRTDQRAKSEKVLSGVSDFSVSGRYLWIVDAETGKLQRTEWKTGGSLGTPSIVFSPAEGERIETFGQRPGEFQKPVCGDSVFWIVVSEDSGAGKTNRQIYAASAREKAVLLWEYDS